MLVVLALAVLQSISASAQPGGRALMAEGNDLFRSGLYRAALLRYREASAAGLDTPLLHYNLGVTHYKLEQYGAAQVELELASRDSRLAPLALFNLGLASRARNERAAAERWFNLALERAEQRDLRKLIERALASLDRGDAPALARERRPSPRFYAPEEPRIGRFNLLAIARLGQSDNVYRSPADPYVDLSQPGQPTVTPVVQSGSFMPVDLIAEYVLHNEAGDTDFNFTYRLDGDFYDSEFSNASELSQRFEIGADLDLRAKEGRHRTLDSAFVLRDHQETNFDPDDGLDRDIAGEDISERFSYKSAGAEGDFEHGIGRWIWGFDMRFERRQYEDTPVVRNYDHEFYFTRASVEYAFNEQTRFKVDGRFYRRLYDERLSRDLGGVLLNTNPVLTYHYRAYRIGIEREVARNFEVGFDYLRVDRMDQFVGYNDYDQHVYRLRATYRPHPRFRISMAALSRTYDYAVAFAFNDPAAGLRELDRTDAELLFEYQITRKFSLWAELDMENVASTDPRAEYARSRSMIGVKWRR